jgi:predicted ester cyclase
MQNGDQDGQTQRNIEATRRWFTEGWLGIDLVEVTFDPALTTNGAAVGLAGPRANIAARLTGFPELATEIMTLTGSSDMVTVQLHWTGTHRGPYGGVAATGKRIDVRVISIWRFADGKVVENWTIQDQFSLLQQVGYLPSELTSAQVKHPVVVLEPGGGPLGQLPNQQTPAKFEWPLLAQTRRPNLPPALC